MQKEMKRKNISILREKRGFPSSGTGGPEFFDSFAKNEVFSGAPLVKNDN